jgi:RimJ/RimL family protein N-acetyltransferase
MRRPPTDEPLVTERLVLEPLLPVHAALLCPALREPDLYTYIPQEPPASVEALEARCRRLASRRSPDGAEVWLNWAARLATAQGTPVYVGTFEATVYGDDSAALAYMIFGPYQRRGYAAEGCRAVLAYLAGAVGVRRAFAEIDTRNAASIALVESLGFARVALRPNADFFKGASSDELRYERALDGMPQR